MKLRSNKVIFFGTAVAMVVIAVLLTQIDGGKKNVRYEQHLSEPDETALGKNRKVTDLSLICRLYPLIPGEKRFREMRFMTVKMPLSERRRRPPAKKILLPGWKSVLQTASGIRCRIRRMWFPMF